MEKDEKKKTVKKTTKKVVKKVEKKEPVKKVVKVVKKEEPVVVKPKEEPAVVKPKEEPAIVKKVEKTNSNINFYLALIFFFLIIVIVFLGLKSCNKSEYCSVKKAIEIGPYDSSEEIKVDTGEIIKNKETYDKYFDKKLDCDLDYGNYNYFVISHPYDTCENKDLKLADFKLEGHSLIIDFEFTIGTTDCQNKQTYYLVPMEKSAPTEGINLTYYEHLID
jgi:hypothetical protein